MKRALLVFSIASWCFLALNADPASAQATRTWVSGVGDDANPCSRTAPCKTFAGAISKTAASGEINCLDPGGYGAVTITKSMTIDCGGTFGSILASGTNGVNVNAAGINVILRNLSINGAVTGLTGVNFISGASLTLDNVIIMNFNSGNATGVQISPNSGFAVFLIRNSIIHSNGLAPATGGGIVVEPAAGGSALVTVADSKIQRNGGSGILLTSVNGATTITVRDSSISSNTNGGVTSTASGSPITVMLDRATVNSNSQSGVLSSGGNSTVRINNSVVHGNALGVTSASGGVLRSYKNNAINANGVDGTPITQEALN